MLNVLSISTDGFSLTFLCPNLKNTAEGSLAYGDFIRGVASHVAFVDNSQRILIKGNQSSCAVVFYRSAFTWLPFYVLNTLWWGPPYKRLQNQATLRSSIFEVDGFLLTCLFHKIKKKKKKTDAHPPSIIFSSSYQEVWIYHWRVSVEAVLYIKLLKVFFRLKQLNSLSGKKIPYHFWNLPNNIRPQLFKRWIALSTG